MTPATFTFPLPVPFSFRQLGSGKAHIRNQGTVATPPMFTLGRADGSGLGRMVNPIIRMVDQQQIIQLAFDGTIDAGRTLTVDVDQRTVLLDGQYNRRYWLTRDSRWFELPAGRDVTIELLAADADSGAQLTVAWRDAHE